jgi:predicted ATPase
MVAYDALGDHAKVTSTYERCKQALRQLELEPSEETRALAFKRSSKIKIPIPLTSFIGREKELKEVAELFSKSRLITLTGSGGVGKTRLAIQVVAEVLNLFPDGVWFLDLAPLSDSSLVPNTLASLIGLRESGEIATTDLLINYFRTRTALVIFDNCEHLISSCAQLMNLLLTSCENLSVLATSRETLRVAGEIPYRVPSLETPKPYCGFNLVELSRMESVKLFVDRATSSSPGFAINQQNAPFISQICLQLDGIPLAIELAAARVQVLQVEEITARLENRFRLLTGGARTALPRHQTLQAMIDWSHVLLSEPERILLRRLSLFVGGWTLEAAETVCEGNGVDEAEILNLLTQLLDKSFILTEREQGRETRYRMLETIRQYAFEKMLAAGEREEICDRHLAYFVKLVEQAEPELYRSNQVYWFNKLDDERDNLRLALEWGLVTNIEWGLRIVTIPWLFWQRHDSREAGNWLRQLLERYRIPDSLRAQALAVSSEYFFILGFMGEARQVAEQALQLARSLSDQQNEALSLMFLGRSLFHDNHRMGITDLRQSLDLYRALGDKIGQATALAWLSNNNDDRERSSSLLEESLILHRELGNLSGIAYCLAFLGYHAIMRGDFVSSGPWLEEARILYHELGDQYYEAFALEYLGVLVDRRGDHQHAVAYFEQVITYYDTAGGFWASWPRVRIGYALLREGNLAQARDILETTIEEFHRNGHVLGVVYTIEGFASLYVIQEQLERATQLFAWADVIREKLGNSRPPVEEGDVDKDITTCLAKMGEAAFSDAYEEGKKLTLQEAIAFALESVS